jgi:hypothetical protein
MFPALVIVPALQICWTLFSILSGMLYFQEYATMQPLPTALFVLGVGVSGGGACVGQSRKRKTERRACPRLAGSVPATLLEATQRWPCVAHTCRTGSVCGRVPAHTRVPAAPGS